MTIIGRMNDGKTCSQRAIEQRVMAAIQPQIDRADRALWELENPRPMPGRHSADWLLFWRAANPPMRRP